MGCFQLFDRCVVSLTQFQFLFSIFTYFINEINVSKFCSSKGSPLCRKLPQLEVNEQFD